MDTKTWTAQQRIDAFKEEFVREMMQDPHITDVRFFGSAQETWRWRHCHSNVDIIVEGDHIPKSVKLKGVRLVETLNYRYGLGLENLPIYHPTPFYVDNRFLEPLAEIVPRLAFVTMPIRSCFKHLGKAGKFPINHRNYWNSLDRVPKTLRDAMLF